MNYYYLSKEVEFVKDNHTKSKLICKVITQEILILLLVSFYIIV